MELQTIFTVASLLLSSGVIGSYIDLRVKSSEMKTTIKNQQSMIDSNKTEIKELRGQVSSMDVIRNQIDHMTQTIAGFLVELNRIRDSIKG